MYATCCHSNQLRGELISPWTKWSPFGQTTFSNAFSWMKMIEFKFKFHWSLFLTVSWIITQNSDNGLAPNRQAIIWTNADLIHWLIYAALVNHSARTQHDKETPWNTLSHYWPSVWWSYIVHDEEICEKYFHVTGPLCGESIWHMLPSQVGHTTSQWNPMRNCSTLLCVEATCEVPWKWTHWGLVTPYGDRDLGQHWLR